MARRIPESVGARVLVGVILTGTLSVLDSTLVVPLLTSIGRSFGAGSEVSWLVAGYLLTSTVTIPLWGRWLDLRGERSSMWVSLGVFLAGTIVSMTAPSLEVLILGRLIQGVGAGGVVPVGQAIIAARCTSEERARLQVYYNVAYGVAAGLGPLLGGILVQASWRWAFAAVIPVILLAGALLWGRLTSRPREAEVRRFDSLGSVLMTAGLTLLLLGIERGWWWALAAGIILVVAFVMHALRRRDGLVPASLLRSRTIVATVIVALIVGLVQFSMLTYLPFLSQRVAPSLNSGIVVIPLTVLWMTLGAFTGVLAMRVGTRLLAVLSMLFAAAAAAAVVASTVYASLILASVLVGTAAGLILIPALLLCQHAAPHEDVGAATSFMVLMRNFGGAAGAALTAVLLADEGIRVAFGTLAVIALLALLPALLLPSPSGERRLLKVRDSRAGG
ncbi:MAG: MFS transporter [Solirubrobacterales bacterium]